MKKYGKNWWIQKVDSKHYNCPWCGGKPKNVLRGKSKLKKDGKHQSVFFIECEHKENIEDVEKYNFPTKFKVEELIRFPRIIGELKS